MTEIKLANLMKRLLVEALHSVPYKRSRQIMMLIFPGFKIGEFKHVAE